MYTVRHGRVPSAVDPSFMTAISRATLPIATQDQEPNSISTSTTTSSAASASRTESPADEKAEDAVVGPRDVTAREDLGGGTNSEADVRDVNEEFVFQRDHHRRQRERESQLSSSTVSSLGLNAVTEPDSTAPPSVFAAVPTDPTPATSSSTGLEVTDTVTDAAIANPLDAMLLNSRLAIHDVFEPVRQKAKSAANGGSFASLFQSSMLLTVVNRLPNTDLRVSLNSAVDATKMVESGTLLEWKKKGRLLKLRLSLEPVRRRQEQNSHHEELGIDRAHLQYHMKFNTKFSSQGGKILRSSETHTSTTTAAMGRQGKIKLLLPKPIGVASIAIESMVLSDEGEHIVPDGPFPILVVVREASTPVPDINDPMVYSLDPTRTLLHHPTFASRPSFSPLPFDDAASVCSSRRRGSDSSQTARSSSHQRCIDRPRLSLPFLPPDPYFHQQQFYEGLSSATTPITSDGEEANTEDEDEEFRLSEDASVMELRRLIGRLKSENQSLKARLRMVDFPQRYPFQQQYRRDNASPLLRPTFLDSTVVTTSPQGTPAASTESGIREEIPVLRDDDINRIGGMVGDVLPTEELPPSYDF